MMNNTVSYMLVVVIELILAKVFFDIQKKHLSNDENIFSRFNKFEEKNEMFVILVFSILLSSFNSFVLNISLY